MEVRVLFFGILKSTSYPNQLFRFLLAQVSVARLSPADCSTSNVWDFDGRELLDMCIMGIGTNTLGYGDPAADEAVGYHGWHDWYLVANLPGEGALAGHLLTGLKPKGVPRGLTGPVRPFDDNDIVALEFIVNHHRIFVIVMEVVRNTGPEDGFLHRTRDLATRKGIVLVFDECTSGFRQTFGGVHKQYEVEPDSATVAKVVTLVYNPPVVWAGLVHRSQK